jgi:putative addiction module CopG family antidote
MANRLTLGKHWENFIQQEVESGRYTSVAEVIRDGLRALEARRNASLGDDFDQNPHSDSLAHRLKASDLGKHLCIDHIINE